MHITGVIEENFQDYEDHISLILFFFGCNFKCSYCYNYNTVTNVNNILPLSPEEAVSAYVTPLTDGLVLLGGEPTIYGDKLLQFALWVKKQYSLDIKLFTNGSNPDLVIRGLDNKIFDKVSIDFKFFNKNRIIDFKKSELTSSSYVNHLLRLLARIKYLGFQDKVQVRTTRVADMPSEDINQISAACKRVGIEHIIQQDVSDSYRRLCILTEAA